MSEITCRALGSALEMHGITCLTSADAPMSPNARNCNETARPNCGGSWCMDLAFLVQILTLHNFRERSLISFSADGSHQGKTRKAFVPASYILHTCKPSDLIHLSSLGPYFIKLLCARSRRHVCRTAGFYGLEREHFFLNNGIEKFINYNSFHAWPYTEYSHAQYRASFSGSDC
ncbi:hypothetical protein METBIDRAFT_115920 [Metschnikowia bicuspidata var. bicuspidata NRRL YB-4993]|uniref:Uncharacterized protein n=1 Tax=Metschnikowia bicuspidata var. bicuspidata NRRL YB-4993 TaxID=869754 RepID=A0A1A0HJ13_9ASCO|nr:hypothetical protein METBIDRAFT_115920 [Metschnikowia bicuspidata var. bicuspidata NRRL YB-4993]OBA23991.1 hypothetical protein METBIDRAFT_115920 [Metschnikowia bicuspidata var. bicuspidata NRRL YB-4993]